MTDCVPAVAHEHPFEELALARYIPILARKLPRFTSYASEIGESGRRAVRKWLVGADYGVSLGYIGIDIAHKVGYHYNQQEGFTETAKWQVFDSTLWHTSASLVLPAAAIHTGVKGAVQLCKTLRYGPMVTRVAPVFFGLALIPAIVHPIDHGVDYTMDRWVRPLYPEEHRAHIRT